MPAVKEWGDQSFTVPAASGSYAPERWTFGDVKAGQPWDAFQGVTASVHTSVATMVVELWIMRTGATKGSVIDGDYKYSGKSFGATGMETWALAAYPGGQIRVKSGGTAGTAVVSCSAF
jgi:hypothetical protein